MEVQIQKSTILNHCNSNTESLLTIFDLLAPNHHVAVVFAFSPSTLSNSDIIEGLTKALVHFPLLMAQLGYDSCQRPCLRTGGGGGGGALVVEATVNSNLADHLPLKPSPDFQLLHPPVEAAAHLLQVQLNRFECGGLVVGVTNHHKVCDGQSMYAFYVAWGQAVRGVPIVPIPVHDRSWLTPRGSKEFDFRNWKLDLVPIPPQEAGFDLNEGDVEVDKNKITNILLHYPYKYITRKLKLILKEKYSTFEILTAHLWRKMTAARGLAGEENTMLRIAVDGRRRLKPAVPNEFFGNLVLSGHCKSTAKILKEEGLEFAVKTIHEAIFRTNDRYFLSIMDYNWKPEDLVNVSEVVYDKNTPVAAPAPILEVDSWLGFQFEEIHFGGGGRLCEFLHSWVPIEGLVILLPSIREDGGVDVFVTLLEEHAERLRKISHSLD